MATVRDRYVDTDVVGGAGNGTSWANAYSSFNAAETAQDDSGDIVTSNEYVVFHCRGVTNADTTVANIFGWTTGVDNYILVDCETADGHAGVYASNKYRLAGASADGRLSISEEYVRLNRLQIVLTSTSASYHAALKIGSSAVGASNDIQISNCLVKAAGNASYIEYAFWVVDTDTNVLVWNSIFYGTSTATNSVTVRVQGCATAKFYSCTISGGYYGLKREAGTVTAKNVYAAGASGYAYNGTITQTTCASSDTTADGTALDSIAYSTATFANVTAGSEDHTLVAGSALIGVGTDTSGDAAPLNFTTDIAGITRS